MFTFLVFLILLVAILLSIVVLLQSGKGGGLAGIASGGQATQILGARQAPDFLEKASWALGTALMVLCFVAPFTIGGIEERRSVLEDRATDVPTEFPIEAPAGGTEAPAGGTDVPAAPATPAEGTESAPE
ncbi:MAG: preprotein translocase subunit SecG [Rhodothermaceae bacterium]|nr:preprotein translocase subunit SecG [Rhodothermaceae bacterium]